MDFYSSTARLLDIILASPRPMLLRPLCAKQGPRSFALLAETLKYVPVLDKLIRSVDLLRSEAEVLQRKPMPSSRALAMLLVHDFLFAKKGIALPKDHKVRQAIERYGTRLKGGLQEAKIKAKVQTIEGLQMNIDPWLGVEAKGKGRQVDVGDSDPSDLDGKIRWMRVNENKWTTEEASDWLVDNGWEEKNTLTEVVAMAGTCFCIDEHIPNLLAFPLKSVSLPKFQPYQDSRLIAQDKASCFPAYLLLHDYSSNAASPPVVIDATSAPGNKTSYASATLKRLGAGQVYAFERNETRFKTLKQMMYKADCRNVETMHADFLECDPYSEPFNQASHILVDPSCSGSGIHSDFDDGTVSAEELQARLKPLSQFQRHILSAALRFPNAQRVVYSTCSVHKEEDEEVVFSMLDNPKFGKEWKLEHRENALPGWPLRGMKEGFEGRNKEDLDGMIRCERRLGTHGFFVAVFVRKNKPSTVATVKVNGGDAEAPQPAAAAVKKDTKKKQEPSRKTVTRSAVTTVTGKQETDAPDFTLLRLATLDRERRTKLMALRAVRKLSSGHDGCCGCAH